MGGCGGGGEFGSVGMSEAAGRVRAGLTSLVVKQAYQATILITMLVCVAYYDSSESVYKRTLNVSQYSVLS